MRSEKFSRLLLCGLTAALAFGCSDTETLDGGTPDAGTVDTGAPDSGIDAGVDAGPEDTGPPPPCLFDQGGPENRGCEPGFVCNVETGQCVAGRACTQNTDCTACTDIRNPIDCGHGYSLAAWCDTSHGSVCTRSRSPCEPCTADAECGFVDFNIVGGDPNTPNPDTDQNKCIDYGEGRRFCGRPNGLSCPQGFREDATTGQCRRDDCGDLPVFCPRGPANQTCTGVDQICSAEPCPAELGGGRCTGNDLPGAIGLCLGLCQSNADCPPDRPVCNAANGLCGNSCSPGTCPGNLVCHLFDANTSETLPFGLCAPPCQTDMDCTQATPNNSLVYGTEQQVYCNLPGRPAPRLFKGGQTMAAYRDDNSCAPLGCERPTDCPVPGEICSTRDAIPSCVPGCLTTEDCPSGQVCKDGPQGSYTREACRALPQKTDDTVIGVCCDQGCIGRDRSCDLNQFCCAEPGSPYASGMCPTLTNSSTITAQPGQCFDLPQSPFCTPAMMDTACNSGWTVGFNSDPDVMGGVAFQEQEFPFGVQVGMAQAPLCGVTCNPGEADSGCPRGWNCGPVLPRCCQDADCGGQGLTCVTNDNGDLPNCGGMPPVPGFCKCGADGIQERACPTPSGLLPAVGPMGVGLAQGVDIANPRCRDPEGDTFGNLYCTAAYNCFGPDAQGALEAPDQDLRVYPMECGF